MDTPRPVELAQFHSGTRPNMAEPPALRKGGEMNNQSCECNWPQQAAADDMVPVMYDEMAKRYMLCLSEEGALMLLRYCPNCGGKLPTKAAPVAFDYAELQKLSELRARVTDVSSLFRELGPPDYTEIKRSSILRFVYTRDWDSFTVLADIWSSGEVTLNSSRLTDGGNKLGE